MNMITKQILKRTVSTDIIVSDIAGQMVRQNHKTKMFSATDMVALFKGKSIQQWEVLNSTEQYIQTVMKREGLQRHEVIWRPKITVGHNRGTWVHPMMAIDLAMWLSPDFKYDVIKWVWDNLCRYKDEAGDNHKLMCEAIHDVLKPTNGFVYADETMMVQDLAGVGKDQRNVATEKQLALLNNLQKWNAKLIRLGITNIVTRRARLIEFKTMMEE